MRLESPGSELHLRAGAMMAQQIGPRELALRAQREQRYQQTHKSKRATAETLKSKIEAIPAKKARIARKPPAAKPDP